MAVRRIVANIAAADLAAAKRFYGDLLGLDVGMDLGWIVTYVADASARADQYHERRRIGHAGPRPSIEVDDVDAVLERTIAAGFPVEYGPADEEWGVRRFFVRDSFGRLVNILSHRD
ncbi:glyoxalase [Ochrobactrum daejeonense]|nr:glyoxalase [Brucella daejeonensis]